MRESGKGAENGLERYRGRDGARERTRSGTGTEIRVDGGWKIRERWWGAC